MGRSILRSDKINPIESRLRDLLNILEPYQLQCIVCIYCREKNLTMTERRKEPSLLNPGFYIFTQLTLPFIKWQRSDPSTVVPLPKIKKISLQGWQRFYNTSKRNKEILDQPKMKIATNSATRSLWPGTRRTSNSTELQNIWKNPNGRMPAVMWVGQRHRWWMLLWAFGKMIKLRLLWKHNHNVAKIIETLK